MKLLKKALDLYIHSSIHVSLAAVCIAYVSVLEYHLNPASSFFWFIFFSTITGYNFVKYAGIAKLHHYHLTKNLRLIQFFSFVAFLALCYTSFLQPLEVLLISGILGLLTFLYALPVFAGKKTLRSIYGIKVFVIVLVWTGTSLLLPVAESAVSFYRVFPLAFIQRFLYIIVLALPLEIRDLKYDPLSLGTLAQKLGIRKTKLLGVNLLLIVLAMELLKENWPMENTIALFFACLLAAWFLLGAEEGKSPYFYSFWGESIPIAWAGALYFLRFFI